MSYCKKSIRKKKKAHRFFARALCFCIMLTGYSDLSGGGSVFAQEQGSLSGNDVPAADIVLPEEPESVSANGTQAGGDGTRAEVYMEGAERQSQPEVEAIWQGADGILYGSSLQVAVEVCPYGTIVLVSDVSLTSGITISRPVLITSYYSDDPYTIKNTTQDTDDGKNSGRIFTVEGGRLVLQDVILDGGKNEGVKAFHSLVCVADPSAVFAMYDGTVLQNAENVSQSICGGGIGIKAGQVFMEGSAKIINCKARHGGGIEVNCSVDDYKYASFAMTGGSIENCEADDGGGVYVNIGSFQMAGGKIAGNRATKEDTGVNRTGGGGIYVAGKAGVASARIAETGKIIGNTGSNGGGILVDGAYAQLYIGQYEVTSHL